MRDLAISIPEASFLVLPPFCHQIDAQRMEDATKTQENVEKLIRIAQLFVDHVCNSTQDFPMYSGSAFPPFFHLGRLS